MSKEIKKTPEHSTPGGRVIAINKMSDQKDEQGRILSESEFLQKEGWEVTETKLFNGVKSHVLVKSKDEG